MPRTGLVLAAVVAVCVPTTGYLLSSENLGSFTWLPGAETTSGPVSHSSPHVASSQAENPFNPAPTPPESTAMGYLMMHVADQYGQSTRYPPWSTPLSSEQAKAYQGNQYEPTTLPLSDGGAFTVTLEKFRFSRGEQILVVAAIQGPQIIGETPTASLQRADELEPENTTKLHRSETSGYFEGRLESDQNPGEYRLVVEARIDGKPVRHASPLTIEPYLGEFEGLGNAYLASNNLVIPVSFSADHAGVYALSAQLFHGPQPVALLQTEQRLDTSSQAILLKAHGTVLADKALTGQLRLRHLHLRELPARPGDRTNHAFGPDEGYTLSAPDLDQLQNTPAVDPESEQRATLLRRLAENF